MKSFSEILRRMNRTEFRNQKLLLRELINPAAVFFCYFIQKRGGKFGGYDLFTKWKMGNIIKSNMRTIPYIIKILKILYMKSNVK